ncbi:alpha/beta fold hydrolase [Streptomyces sp. NPDC087908]|uniref:alpha/beta fold hydrolase n=1 Tax=Streptomyces sp. NPDC087908 TaxID=3365820 RepID=UPI00380F185D
MDEVSAPPAGVRGRVVSRDGTPIAYERYGEGPPLVLVSGALGTAEGERPLGGLLARRFSVVAYDRRGRGGSGDGGPYAVEREVEDLAAVVGAAGPGAALHGTGTGGALVLAAVAAGLPAGAVSVFEPPYSTAAAELRRRVTELLDGGRPAEALAVFLAESTVPARLRPGAAELAHTLAYDMAVLGEGTADGALPEGLLSRVHARVLVVDGGVSPAGTRQAARAVTGALPRARHRTLTGQTHDVAPHVLAPVLEEFLGERREPAEAA